MTTLLTSGKATPLWPLSWCSPPSLLSPSSSVLAITATSTGRPPFASPSPKGAIGSVYKCVLGDGRKVAIKSMDQTGKQEEEEFKVEVELLSRLHSPYLLSLLGYCSENSRKLLVYEFMANGGLQEHLYVLCDKSLVFPEFIWNRVERFRSDVI